MITTEKIMDVALQLAGLSAIPADSGVWVPGDRINKILFGIDVGPAEIEIAKRMGYDLVIAHHPPEATIDAWKVFMGHVDQMTAAGVSKNVAQDAVADQIEAMKMSAHARNDQHTVSVARLIKMPYMNIHTPLDEIGRQRLQCKFDALVKKNPDATVGDVFQALEEFKEVENARVRPLLAVGRPEKPAGRVLVAHAALDVPNYAIMDAYYSHGVDTILTLRVSQKDLERLRKEKLGALIVIGHMAGDSLGFTSFLSRLTSMGLDITTFSGVIVP